MNIIIKNEETNETKQYSIINNIIKDSFLAEQLKDFLFCNSKYKILFVKNEDSTDEILNQLKNIPKSIIESNYEFFSDDFHKSFYEIINPLIQNEQKDILEKNIFLNEQKIRELEKQMGENIQFIRKNNKYGGTINEEIDTLEKKIRNMDFTKFNFREKQENEEKYWELKEVCMKYLASYKEFENYEVELKKINFERNIHKFLLNIIMVEYNEEIDIQLNKINKYLLELFNHFSDKLFTILYKDKFDYSLIQNQTVKDINVFFYEKKYINFLLNIIFSILLNSPIIFISNELFDSFYENEKKVLETFISNNPNNNFFFC